MSEDQRAAARKALRGTSFTMTRDGDTTIITPKGKQPVTIQNGVTPPAAIEREIAAKLRGQ